MIWCQVSDIQTIKKSFRYTEKKRYIKMTFFWKYKNVIPNKWFMNRISFQILTFVNWYYCSSIVLFLSFLYSNSIILANLLPSHSIKIFLGNNKPLFFNQPIPCDSNQITYTILSFINKIPNFKYLSIKYYCIPAFLIIKKYGFHNCLSNTIKYSSNQLLLYLSLIRYLILST